MAGFVLVVGIVHEVINRMDGSYSAVALAMLVEVFRAQRFVWSVLSP